MSVLVSVQSTYSASQLDRDPHQGAVFCPTSVVVLDIPVAEEFVQNEPGVRRPFPDSAVRNRLLGVIEAGRAVELLQVVVRLEGAVLVGGLAPRHVDRARDVARPLALLLRQG